MFAASKWKEFYQTPVSYLDDTPADLYELALCDLESAHQRNKETTSPTTNKGKQVCAVSPENQIHIVFWFAPHKQFFTSNLFYILMEKKHVGILDITGTFVLFGLRKVVSILSFQTTHLSYVIKHFFSSSKYRGKFPVKQSYCKKRLQWKWYQSWLDRTIKREKWTEKHTEC